MFCKIIDNTIVNPSNFEGEREFDISYYTFIASPKNYYIYDAELDNIIVNPNFDKEEKQKKIDKFNAEFFNTSLGYIRRSVQMKDGSHKDFLSDLLPTITMAFNMGNEVKVIAYDRPDFENLRPIKEYQHNETVTAQFIQDCFLQLSADFV